MNAEVEIIKGARELLSDPARWKKNSWGNPERTCIEGALGLAACGNTFALLDNNVPESLQRAEELVLKQAQPFGPKGFADLATFNDEDGTTYEDVLTVLDKALADCGGLG